MKKSIILSLLLLLSIHMMADNSDLLDELDQTIELRSEFIATKKEKIEFLKQQCETEKNNEYLLKLYQDIYAEYYVFKFDSAMAYVNKGLNLAKDIHNNYYTSLNIIQRSELLAIAGLYSEAINNLNQIDSTAIDRTLMFKLNVTYFYLYSYWTDYCNDNVFAPGYREKANSYLIRAMQYIDKNDGSYEYYMGEFCVYIDQNDDEARRYYHQALKVLPENSRYYAMSCFALSGNYGVHGDNKRHEEYLIRASLSDLKSCTMENMALQNLAMCLYQQNRDNIERAERYINLSLEDAKFYNSRLRIIEISQKLPQIVSTYKAMVKHQNHLLRYALLFISILLLGFVTTIYFIFRQNRLLTVRRKELAANNQQLTDLNQQLSGLNHQLHLVNDQLVDTNKKREGLASIYIDLCAKYIDKLGKYQTLVKRKIKANQAQELLQAISSARISEEDAATFLTRFDKAFIELYPTFVEEFNALLTEDGRIQRKSPHSLTTELRTFALIRLGVKNTADIAGLLFLSPQTIYNCRSVTKNKAINKETFEGDVLKLCTVIGLKY